MAKKEADEAAEEERLANEVAEQAAAKAGPPSTKLKIKVSA